MRLATFAKYHSLVNRGGIEPTLTASTLPRQDGRFRKDIQGLRALAVLMVLAFHACLPVPGGFVGVDVFFAISGFVITSMLHREWEATGRIRLGAFYTRRFKRLAPALALLVAVTVVASAFVLSPFGAQQTAGKTALGALLISANIVITRITGGYFDAPAATNPLLHTWSLSVEEQFYLAFPLIVMMGWTVGKRWRRLRVATQVTVALVAAGSFGAAVLALSHPPGPRTDWLIGYYGPVSRAWEFAAGALLSLVATRLARTPRSLATALGLGGGAMLGASLWLMSEATPHPGPWTLLPVLGTLLLLVAGTGQTNVVSRALALGPLVKVGDWSYSIYLWHWPLIVLASSRWPDRRWITVAAAIVSFAPALASYRWVETPLRELRVLTGARLARVVAAVVVPAIALSGAALYAADHIWAPRLQSGDVTAALHGEVAWKDHDYRSGGYQPCADLLRAMVEQGPETRCQQSKPGPDVDMALLGDSHAEHIFIGLLEALPATNIVYFSVNAFPSKSNPYFTAALNYVIGSPSIKNVIVTAFWAARGVDEPSLVEVLRSLVKSGKHVFITDDVPSFSFDPFGCKVHTTGCSQDIAVFRGHYTPYYEMLMSVTRQVTGVRLMRIAKYLCNEKECSMALGGDILYADPSHLNMLGSRYVGGRMVAEYWRWLN